MVKEVVDLMGCKAGGIYLDCTAGGGGHSARLLEASSPNGRVIALDRDPDAIAETREALKEYKARLTLVQSDYKEFESVLETEGFDKLDGILADLGISSHQIDCAERGFSFMKDGPLDMRMDSESGETASEMLMRLPVGDIEHIIRKYGEEKWARAIARAIKEAGSIGTTLQLAKIVAGAVPKRFHPARINVATKTFQALRIAVNEELAGLDKFISDAVSKLKTGGRIAIISFHSLEDRVIKQTFKALAKSCICPPDLPYCRCDSKASLKIITRKSVMASQDELNLNPRARSARLRVAEKI
jgi:16S rRNA (cytosine1402-N4)-methyltransferase